MCYFPRIIIIIIKNIHQSNQNRIEQQHMVEQLTRIFSVKITDLSDFFERLVA